MIIRPEVHKKLCLICLLETHVPTHSYSHPQRTFLECNPKNMRITPLFYAYFSLSPFPLELFLNLLNFNFFPTEASPNHHGILKNINPYIPNMHVVHNE